MNPNSIPQQLASIPYGQIFILTRPHKGITYLHIRMMEIIRGVSRHYHPECIIQTMAVDNPELWDCAVCKVKSEDGDEMIISKKASLLEMLCELWELDYDEVCKTINIPNRNKDITCGEGTHPVKITLIPSKKEGPMTKKADSLFTNYCITVVSREDTLEDIRSTLKENFDYDLDITLDEIIAIYKAEQENRKTYSLDIHIERKRVYEHPKWVQKIKACDISLVSNTGEKYPLKISAQAKAIYLTYILYKDGLRIKEVSENEEFYKIFKKISCQMPRMQNIPDKFVFFYYDEKKKDSIQTPQFGLFNDKIQNIRDAILDATNSVFLKDRFAVEGIPGFPYKVAGATDEDRDFIKREFGIK